MAGTRKYYVLMLDMVGSSKLDDRKRLTDVLRKTITGANRRFRGLFQAPFEITKGDEIAAVMRSVGSVYDMITHFGDHIAPVGFRAVVVFDELNAGIETRRSTIMDGPAFYKADALMARLKKTQKWVAFDTGQQELEETAATVMNLVLMQWYQLTGLQRTIIRTYQDLKNQTLAAERLRKKQQQIQNTLMQSRWEIIDGSESLLRSLCARIDEKNKTAGRVS